MTNILLAVIVVLAAGLSGCAPRDPAAVKIGDVEISAKEFEQSFQESRYPKENAGRLEFLTSLIRKKLILREAERMGMDKDPQFLQDIQAYWEQGLLKQIVSRKTNELVSGLQVTDPEINEYYAAHRDSYFADSELPKVYGQIKWYLLQEKQAKALSGWVDGLEKRTEVSVDYDLLGIREIKNGQRQ